jgi:hypothetical protein
MNLQLYYIPSIPRKLKSLEVWPALPLLIDGAVHETSIVDDIVAELEHRDRICQINLESLTLQDETLWTAMRVPFPELAALNLSMGYLLEGPVLPDSFLGGSAPRLRSFSLSRIPFPGLPRLLLSATHLVNLHLRNIPHFGYISPEAMATCLSTLASLESLQLEFQSQSYTDLKSRRPSPPSLSVLPSLAKFSFNGANEYLEEFVARIDAPQLYQLWTRFFDDIDLNTPELNQFISRAPALGAFDEAYLALGGGRALVRLCSFQHELFGDGMFQVQTFCRVSHRQLSTLAQICTLSLPPLLTIENLYIEEYLGSFEWVDDIENSKWLDLLLPFTAVKNLYLSQHYLPLIAPALQELTGGRTTEVLPALQNVLLEGFQPPKPVHEGIAQFISVRQLTNHPVAISTWDRDLVGGRGIGGR